MESFITLKEIATHLRISYTTAKRLMLKHHVATKIDKKFYIPVQKYQDFLTMMFTKDYAYNEHGTSRKKLISTMLSKGSIKCYKKNGKAYYYIINCGVGYDENGKEILFKNPKGGYKNKEMAKKAHKQLLLERLTTQQQKQNSVPSLYEYICTMIENDNTTRETTRITRLSVVHNNMKPLAALSITEISLDAIQAYVNQIKRGAVMQGAIIKSALHRLYLNEYLKRDLSKFVHFPTHKAHEKQALSKGQLKTYLDYLSSASNKQFPLKYVVFFMAGTGVRLGEALALNWKDIDLDNCCCHINKTISRAAHAFILCPPKTTASNRTVYFSERLADLLRPYKEKATTKFFAPASYKVQRICPSYFRLKYFFNVSKTLNFPFSLSPHILRHTYITNMLYAGANMKDIQKQVGHSNLSMIMQVYSHTQTDALKERLQDKLNTVFST